MKILAAFIIAVMLTATASAQWETASEINAGSTGKLTSHNNQLYIYGTPGGSVGDLTSLSNDNGLTWIDIRDRLPQEYASDMVSFNGGEALYVLIAFQGIHVSTDNGETFTLVNTPVPAQGALNGLASDGETLFAITNTEKFYVSADRAETWNELAVTHPDGQVSILKLAAAGDTYVAIASQIGAMVSTDAGATWNEVNPDGGLTNVMAYQGSIYASGGNGVYIWNAENESWTARSGGLPGDGAFVFPVGLTAHNGTIFTVLNSPFYNDETAYSSTNMGQAWTELSSEGYPAPGFATLYNIAANDDYIFLYVWNSSDDAKVYRLSNLVTSVTKYDDAIVNEFALEQNYPNPFNPTTTIRFAIPESQHVSLKVYDILGGEVAELVNGNLSPGNYSFDFDAHNLSSGIYIYAIKSASFSSVKKMMLIK